MRNVADNTTTFFLTYCHLTFQNHEGRTQSGPLQTKAVI